MRILLDECLPRKFALLLTGHDIRSVHTEGWSGIKNGELLKRALGNNFQVFITVDRSISYQQNYKNISLAIIVLAARSNQIEDIAPLSEYVLATIRTVKPGDIVVVGM